MTIRTRRLGSAACPTSPPAPAPCSTCTPPRRSWCWPTSGTSSPRGWSPRTDGVRALATASHSIAATFGYEDGENIPLDLHLDMVGRIVAAVDLPVTMDFEAGYGDAGETARRAIEAGVVGGNLEDQMKPLDEAVAAVEAVLAAGRDAGIDFVLNARTDAFVRAAAGRRPRASCCEEAIRRGRAFLDGGRTGGVRARASSRREEIARPRRRARAAEAQRHQRARALAARSRELQELGVARVSTGPFTQRVALTALQDAAAALVGGGIAARGHPGR